MRFGGVFMVDHGWGGEQQVRFGGVSVVYHGCGRAAGEVWWCVCGGSWMVEEQQVRFGGVSVVDHGWWRSSG